VINTDGDVDGASEFAIVGDTVISPKSKLIRDISNLILYIQNVQQYIS
jgi:hypothetical protein